MSSTANFVFELGLEELPPKSLLKLSQSLKQTLETQLAEHKLAFSNIQAFSTPRRIAILIHSVQTQQPAQIIVKKGPPLNRAVDAQGKPTQAGLGFATSVGVDFEALETIETEKGTWLSYQAHQPGKPIRELLPVFIERALAQLPLDKAMRWGDESFNFIRPVHWVLALLDDQVMPIKVFNIIGDRITLGHRVHCPEPIRLANAADYEAELEKQGWVIPCFAKRQQTIKTDILAIATQNHSNIAIDPDLLDEITALVEWPVALKGTFESNFLEVPRECLISSMQANQKYFALFDQNDQIKNEFVFVANLKSQDEQTVIQGNERVIRPRLADAAFFYHKDQTKSIEQHRTQLKQVALHKKLGSVWDKTERLASLTQCIGKHLGIKDTHLLTRAGVLSKADLVTQMAQEFPELQGTMGGYYAEKSSEPREVVEAIKEQYLPRFNADDLPNSQTGICLSLADKIDLLVGIFGIGEHPSGEKDPYGLRRASLGVIRICIEKSLDLELDGLLKHSLATYSEIAQLDQNTLSNVNTFIEGRYKSWYQSLNVPTPIIQSVEVLGISNPKDFDQRIKAVQEFMRLDASKSLAAANKRVKNLLKHDQKIQTGAEEQNSINQTLLIEPAEKVLAEKLKQTEKTVSPLLRQKDYGTALEQLSKLGPYVDDLFDQVMILCDDKDIKQNRINLLKMLSNAFKQIADISFLAA